MASSKKEVLIADLQRVNQLNNGEGVTRNFYRDNGEHSEKSWQKHFNRFEDFLVAAGVNKPVVISEVLGKTWSVFLPSTALASPKDVITFCNIDTNVWELDRFRAKDVSKGDQARFQISAFFKKREDIIAIRAEIEDLKTQAKASAPTPSKTKDHKSKSGNLLEINISDAHFGKLAWPKETGSIPYDVQIARAMFIRALDTLLDRVKNFEFEQILFVVGNDLLNSDNAENTTTKGTVVTTDIRYHKTFRTVRFLMQECIEKLRKIAPVKVLIVPGNHDQLASWHLGDSLECAFAKYSDVEVDNDPRYRKYHEFGKCMIAFTHGDKGDRTDYPLLIATEQPEMFGRTKFREIHTGHTHETKTQEKHGVRVRVISALTPADDWHSENGYVGNLRTAEAYVWNREQGLISIMYHNDDSAPVLVTKREIV